MVAVSGWVSSCADTLLLNPGNKVTKRKDRIMLIENIFRSLIIIPLLMVSWFI
ncbi:MAG: hypothetical protein ACD_35C00058G0001 [uncultured bacterium]|nr:MAG: hypothetical protein ACD_35C00058G0001 [uncultured bacterium]